eukprot:GHVU01075426.1.p1 GENE.GHVU01075426.1~~GHVU01075426.1.p1  ORF type:complete len:507 (+),score=17.56 GHVU01075426.1:80-1600(+)
MNTGSPDSTTGKMDYNSNAPIKSFGEDGPAIEAHGEGGEVRLKRTLGLFSGVGLIAGSIIGSGIFVSPKGVLMESGSVGLALCVWTASGLICLLGAHCFAELGTCIRKSGGMYAYIQEAFGNLAAFVYLWAALVIIFPAANAVIALTCANYILQPLFPTCSAPDAAVRLIAAAAILLLTFVNCASVKWAARIQNIFAVIKILALLAVIGSGIYVLAIGHTENFVEPFKGASKNPGNLALAFYSGLFSYSGWYTLNFLTEELINPYQNLPRAIWISMPLVTVIYVLANVAYFAVLTPVQIMESDAVAVTYAFKLVGQFGLIMPLLVACSTFGSLNGCIMSVARVFYVGAREGHLPDMLALININYFTPMPAVAFQGLVSVAMLVTSDVFVLINYVTFIEALSFLACILALLYFRYKYPDLERPIKVNILSPILFTIVSLFLVIFPLFSSPWETGVGLVILLSGIPVYCIGVVWKNKPRYFKNKMVGLTQTVQKLTTGLPQDAERKDQ